MSRNKITIDFKVPVYLDGTECGNRFCPSLPLFTTGDDGVEMPGYVNVFP